MKGLFLLIGILFIAFIIPPLQGASLGSGPEEKPFVNIGPLAVLVEDMDEDAKTAWLDKDEIQAQVELKLRQNGIPVRNLRHYTTESSYIYINVNLLYLKQFDHHIYNVELSLYQRIFLLHNSFTKKVATWDKSKLGISPGPNTRAKVKGVIDDLLTSFLNNYLAVNPPDKK